MSEDLLAHWFAEIIGTKLNHNSDTARTARRAAQSWRDKTAGYDDDPLKYFTRFETHTENVRGMVLVRDIEIESLCEHHLERVWGYAHIAYIPTQQVLGLSKFYRIANAFARRLQLQERLTAQIADCIQNNLHPQGVGVVIEARHACMEARGIMQRGQVTTTSELRGAFYNDSTTRAEFIALAKTAKHF